MAKGQQRSNREKRKPKKSAAERITAATPASVPATLANWTKASGKKRP